MYCRNCYYDLRGQQTPRCPECGTAFAFDDRDSFLRAAPGRPRKLLFWLRRRRRKLVIASTILLLSGYVVANSELPSLADRIHVSRLAGANLKAIMSARRMQQYENPQERLFDTAAAKHHTQPSYSPWTERRSALLKALTTYMLRWAPLFVPSTIAYLLLMAALVGKRARRAVFVLVIALTLMLIGSYKPRRSAGFLLSGSHAFLSDIVHIQGVDVTTTYPQRGKTIAAYDIKSFRQPGRRGIAFADGHVQWWWDERAKPLFQAQGIPYPEVDMPDE